MTQADGQQAPAAIPIVVSIDTEEDNWGPTTDAVTSSNIAELPRLASVFRRLGVKPTYFCTYQVAVDPDASSVLRDIAKEGRSELGAHLHPWNTPPYCGSEDRRSMLRRYSEAAQRDKVRVLLDTLRSRLGIDPQSFRAGRFGIGRKAVRILIDAGIAVDSSVTPLMTWKDFGGPSFLDAENQVYRVDGTDNICHASPHGRLVEVPISVGFTRFHPRVWTRLARGLDSARARRWRIPGLVNRLSGVKKVILSPELEKGSDMVQLGRHMHSVGIPYLHMYFHSNSLVPGLTPFTPTAADVRRLYDSIEAFVEGMAAVTEVAFCTVSEVARQLDPRSCEPGVSRTDGDQGRPLTA